MPATYDVFLSHSTADKPVVEAPLAWYRATCASPHWRPRFEGSPTIAVLIGPKGIERWHDQQHQLALVLAAEERGKRVIPVLLAGASRQSLKGFLGLRTRIDFDEVMDFVGWWPGSSARRQTSSQNRERCGVGACSRRSAARSSTSRPSGCTTHASSAARAYSRRWTRGSRLGIAGGC
jgi:hypothetical protein